MGHLRGWNTILRDVKLLSLGDVEGNIFEVLTQLSLENDLSELNTKSLRVDEDE